MAVEEVVKARVDRRTFLKAIGAAGATLTVMSACAPAPLGGQATTPVAGGAPAASGTGAATTGLGVITLKGPGGNLHPAPGYALPYVPKEMALAPQAGDQLARLPKEKLATTYERMVASRKWETKMKDLFVEGKDGLYGAFHIYIGEEAIANGVVAALNDDDYIVSTHRGHGHLIAKGGDLNKMSAEIFFKQTGANKGYGGSMHIVEVNKGILGANGIVGASWYLGAGAAYSAKVRGSKQVAVSFAGDGAANSPYFFSAVRSATLYKLPWVAVVENNFQMIAVPMAAVTPTPWVADYVKGLGIPAVTIDGNDVAAVYAHAKQAVERARAGEGPSLIECVTYRWYDHAGMAGAKVGQDGAFGLPYRSDEEVRAWMARDPIARFRQFLIERKLFTEAELNQIDARVQEAVEKSVEFARTSPDPKPEWGVQNVYAREAVAPTQFFAATPTPGLASAGTEVASSLSVDYL